MATKSLKASPPETTREPTCGNSMEEIREELDSLIRESDSLIRQLKREGEYSAEIGKILRLAELSKRVAELFKRAVDIVL